MSEIKKRNNTCLLPDCHREAYENGKCILHCEKDKEHNWYKIDENGEKYWNKSKLKKFWGVIYDLWGSGKSLTKVFFPRIDDSDELSNVNDGSELKTKEGIIFEFNHFLKISNSTFLDDFKLNCKFKFYDILFENTKFLGKLEINNVKIETELQFNYVIFDKRTDFILLNCKELEFYNSTFSGISYFRNLKNLKKLEIANSPKIKKICIRECNIDSVDICKNKVFNEIEIGQKTIIDHLKLSNKRIDVLSFKGKCKFNTVAILGEYKKQMCFDEYDIGSDFEINDCIFNDGSYIVIKKMNFNNFSIIDNDNISDAFCLYDTKIDNKIRFEYTDISNFEFYNLDIEHAYKIFKNISFISNNGFTIFNRVKWGDIRNTFDKATDRDTYRQLKYVNEKQGNIIEANKFYSAEMEAYKKEITAKESKAPYREKIIFWMNYLVSDFGRSWILPLLWYLVLGLFFSFLYFGNLLQNIPALCLITVTIVGFYSMIKFKMKVPRSLLIALVPSFFYYFSEAFVKKEYWDLRFNQLLRFINPFDKIEDTNTGRMIWWIVFRLIAVFIIYQFIISLRRQTRR
ncbi:MAG: hypothetical protein HQ534_12805 [Armatimonadetes bacterium]|nr:hypothetical protein [Armatimonadota bacterium]